jgi:hypothetical protein
VPACREARGLIARKAELTHSGGEVAEIRECWEELRRLEQEVAPVEGLAK